MTRTNAARTWTASAAIALLAVSSNVAGADGDDIAVTPDQYIVKISGVKLCKDSTCGANAVEISSSTLEVDIASLGVGASTNAGAAGVQIPPGVYTFLSFRLSNKIGVKGRIPGVQPGKDCITNGSAGQPYQYVENGTTYSGVDYRGTLVSSAQGSPVLTLIEQPEEGFESADGKAKATFQDGYYVIRVELSSPINVKLGEAIEAFGINFNASNKLHGSDSSENGDGVCDTGAAAPHITVTYGGTTVVDINLDSEGQ